MTQQTVIWIVIAIYAAFMLAIGVLNARHAKSISDFTVGKRNAGAWITALSYGTAYFSAVMFIGYAGGSGWDYGLWAVLPGIGNAVIGSLLAWLVLAKRTREVTTRLKIKSMPQFFEKRYHSQRMKLFSCIIIFVFLLPYSASVYKGLTSICSVLLHVDETTCMLIIAIASACILVLGGYLATLKADFVQGFIMMIGVAVLIVAVVRSQQVGGLQAGIQKMTDYMQGHGMLPLSASATVSLWSTVLMTSFGTWGLPQMIHKYYGIKDDREVRRGTVISTFFSFLVAGVGYFIGSLSHLYFGEVLPQGGKDYLVPNMLLQANLPYILLGVVLVLLISASVSTLSSITLTACSTVTMDLIAPRSSKEQNPLRLANVTKVLCLLFVAASYLIANSNTPILEMMSYSWGVISGSFLAPYLLALYCKWINAKGAWSGILSGFVIALLPVVAKLFVPTWAAPFGLGLMSAQGPLFACLAMAVSLLVCLSVSFVTRKREEEHAFFYEGTVAQE